MKHFDIDKLEQLPKRIGIRKAIKANNKIYRRYSRHNSYESEGLEGISLYTILRRIERLFTNKHINDAYSYYLSLTNKPSKKEFMNWFYPNYYWRTKLVGDNGLINEIKKSNNKKPIKVTLNDGVWEKRSKKTGRLYEDCSYYDKYSGKNEWIHVYTGTILTFETKKDPKFKRVISEQQKQKRIQKKLRKKAFAEKSYSFISKKEIQLKEEKRLDRQKLYAHGFDDASFKGFKYSCR
jgi:hypothetical protein